MKTKKQKGFTLVELVIVIAVIAILAAVLIPTFSNLIQKANQSADIQATREMNTQLALVEADGKPETIADAVKALDEVNINLDDYSPLAKNTQFYWIKSINRVIYVSLSDNKVLYPENYADYVNAKGDKYSLNGDIELLPYTIEMNNSVSISEGGQLAKLIDDVNNGKSDATNVTKITLTEDIYLEGATSKFKASGTTGTGGFSKEIEIDGNNKTIYGFRDDTQTTFGSGVFANKGYGYGLFGNIGANGKVTIKNVTFSGITVRDTAKDSGTAGLIAGYIYGTLTMDKVTFKDCSVSGNQKIGAIVGQLYGTLNMTGVKFENTTVSGSCEVAKVAGYVNYSNTTGGNLSATDCEFNGISTISLVENTFTSASFSVKLQGAELKLKGDINNTFKYTPSHPSGDQYIGVYNVTTNDWAWYRISSEESNWNGTGTTSYNGSDGLFLNGSSFSASKNFVNGKPVE